MDSLRPQDHDAAVGIDIMAGLDFKFYLNLYVFNIMKFAPHRELLAVSKFAVPQGPASIVIKIVIAVLALACLGIFGVVSYGVALRTKEIGIRVALGARQPALLRSIVRQVLKPVGIGALIGLVLAMPTGLALASEPFYLEHADPIAFGAALAVFGTAVAAAALWPAYQVLKRNPVDALRHS